MLKKQTVWLLTMLSLMIVLSVYYMSSPSGEDLAYINSEPKDSDQVATKDLAEGETSTEQAKNDAEGMMTSEEGQATSSVSTDELFATIRMEIQDKRSKRLDQLDDIVASATATTEEINQAYDEMKQIESVSTREYILEETIKAEGYPAALVRTKDNSVEVIVKADELFRTETVNIMQMVSDEFGEVNVEVKFQPVS